SPCVLAADGDVYDRARRGLVLARGGRADALLRVGGHPKDRRASLNREAFQGFFISIVTRAGGWSPTLTFAEVVPRRSCQTWSLYEPGGRLSKANCPSAPVIA